VWQSFRPESNLIERELWWPVGARLNALIATKFPEPWTRLSIPLFAGQKMSQTESRQLTWGSAIAICVLVFLLPVVLFGERDKHEPPAKTLYAANKELQEYADIVKKDKHEPPAKTLYAANKELQEYADIVKKAAAAMRVRSHDANGQYSAWQFNEDRYILKLAGYHLEDMNIAASNDDCKTYQTAKQHFRETIKEHSGYDRDGWSLPSE
jgi:hypothetical protein